MNDVSKINARVLAAWGEILIREPRSRLLLKARDFGSADVRDRVLRSLADTGVDAARIELRGWEASRREHLELYSHIDLALDTFPYNGATTTCEALYMGVPVITLPADRHAGRMGVSILSAVGSTSSSPDHEMTMFGSRSNGRVTAGAAPACAVNFARACGARRCSTAHAWHAHSSRRRAAWRSSRNSRRDRAQVWQGGERSQPYEPKCPGFVHHQCRLPRSRNTESAT